MADQPISGLTALTAAATGYPLSDIMSQLHIDALVEVDSLKAEKVALEASIAEVAQKQAELDAAKEVPAQ